MPLLFRAIMGALLTLLVLFAVDTELTVNPLAPDHVPRTEIPAFASSEGVTSTNFGLCPCAAHHTLRESAERPTRLVSNVTGGTINALPHEYG